jgi:capsular polysaccharide transport system ATP-binding protein
MITMNGVSKSYSTRHGHRLVLDNVDLRIRKGEKIGIFGRNGSGKSTLIRLISGIEYPTSGQVSRSMTVSWPLAFTGAFQGGLTGMDNLRFICRIYGTSPEKVLPFVREFSELGDYLSEPVKAYSSGMRARLAFALSMAIDFDCFLIDEVIAVGDSKFHAKCRLELFENRKDRALIIASHDLNTIKEFCDKAVVITNGRVVSFTSIDDAIDNYLNS